MSVKGSLTLLLLTLLLAEVLFFSLAPLIQAKEVLLLEVKGVKVGNEHLVSRGSFFRYREKERRGRAAAAVSLHVKPGDNVPRDAIYRVEFFGKCLNLGWGCEWSYAFISSAGSKVGKTKSRVASFSKTVGWFKGEASLVLRLNQSGTYVLRRSLRATRYTHPQPPL